jgi:3-methylfumaryl-CoA hydratase
MNDYVERTELLAPEPALALADLLDVAPPDLSSGEGLPLTWHWLYLLERAHQGDLGPDGHPVRNALPSPPGPGRRRMWAGGHLRGLGPLRVGEPATRRSNVLDTTEKHGRRGRLTLVRVSHTIIQRGRPVIEERQDIAYLDAAASPPVETSDSEERDRLPIGPDEWSVRVTPTLLFRFSALTYNAHRIHYDRDYARGEGYPGLVVHGPLQAVVMAEAARRRGATHPGGGHFEYRLVAPLFEGQGLVARSVEHDGAVRTTVRDDWGRVTAEGRAGA